MASRYELEVTIKSAKDLKNINWRHGPLRPYAVIWVDPNTKCSTRVDEEGDMTPFWDQTLVIPLPPGGRIEDHTLSIDIVHAGAEEDTKPLIGSARLSLVDVIDDVGIGERALRSLQIKRPSGRPQGKLDIYVTIKESRYRAPDPYYAPPYGVPPPPMQGSRDIYGYPNYASPYSAPPPPNPYYSTAPPPSGYPYSGYNAPPSQQGQSSYRYGQVEEKKKNKFGGIGTGLAVGAVAGVLGGIAIAEGVDALEDHIADDVTDRVEDDLGYDGDDF
ncbi:Calcium-dependent lipid-binding (CaLB domain) family protein [Euphorbia peplus]|nr:Calcium-dependent lipid-binding (CaLB domain) family protein [Euphorbia peplus]